VNKSLFYISDWNGRQNKTNNNLWLIDNLCRVWRVLTFPRSWVCYHVFFK